VDRTHTSPVGLPEEVGRVSSSVVPQQNVARLAPDQRQALDDAAASAIVRGGTRGSGPTA
jgi:hypothetical protein